MSQQQRIESTREVLQLLSAWGVDREHQLLLLGLPSDTRPRVVQRFLQGEPLPPDAKVQARVECLLQVDAALVSLFPHNPVMANLWVSTQSPQFDGRAPLDMMLEQGLPAMQSLLSQLDGSGDAW